MASASSTPLGAIIAPRAALSPDFEANLDSMLGAVGTTVEPDELTVRDLQGGLGLTFVFLMLTFVIVAGTRPERLERCPDGELTIVDRDLDGSRSVLCHYQVDVGSGRGDRGTCRSGHFPVRTFQHGGRLVTACQYRLND